jgi:alcohol dehydrogenase (NADP+)
VCASDIHTLRSGWGETDYPAVVGHEIVGIVTRVGKDITHIKEGDRVGVGAQSDSCLECERCKHGMETYCDSMVGTYNSKYADGSGKTRGGYAKHWRGPGHFAVPIPDNLESHIAAPLMCGGITIASPLMDYGCGGPDGKRVGIVGVGGIGHFGIGFAKALGATTIVAISTTSSKKDMAHELGATDFVAMKENPEDWKRFRRGLDIIINTASNEDAPFDTYIWMLRPRGHLINIAIPEKPVMSIPIPALLFSGANIGGSAMGGIPQIEKMLKLAGDKKPNFMIEKRKVSRQICSARFPFDFI